MPPSSEPLPKVAPLRPGMTPEEKRERRAAMCRIYRARRKQDHARYVAHRQRENEYRRKKRVEEKKRLQAMAGLMADKYVSIAMSWDTFILKERNN